jgi:hypothetical protein
MSYLFLVCSLSLLFMARTFESRIQGKQSSETREEALKKLKFVKLSTWYGLLPFAVVFMVFAFFLPVKLSYTAKAIGNYNQLLNLVGPFVTPNEVLVFNSRFAQVTSAQDYVVLKSELRAIAQSHKLRLPKFEPW